MEVEEYALNHCRERNIKKFERRIKSVERNLLAVWIGTLLDSATGATYISTRASQLLRVLTPYPPAMKKALEALRKKSKKEKFVQEARGLHASGFFI